MTEAERTERVRLLLDMMAARQRGEITRDQYAFLMDQLNIVGET